MKHSQHMLPVYPSGGTSPLPWAGPSRVPLPCFRTAPFCVSAAETQPTSSARPQLVGPDPLCGHILSALHPCYGPGYDLKFTSREIAFVFLGRVAHDEHTCQQIRSPAFLAVVILAGRAVQCEMRSLDYSYCSHTHTGNTVRGASSLTYECFRYDPGAYAGPKPAEGSKPKAASKSAPLRHTTPVKAVVKRIGRGYRCRVLMLICCDYLPRPRRKLTLQSYACRAQTSRGQQASSSERERASKKDTRQGGCEAHWGRLQHEAGCSYSRCNLTPWQAGKAGEQSVSTA